jgi:hypothetical protein
MEGGGDFGSIAVVSTSVCVSIGLNFVSCLRELFLPYHLAHYNSRLSVGIT